MKDEGKPTGHVLIDMVKAQRCLDIPVAVEFEVVRRRSVMKMVGGQRKSACIRPYGSQSTNCLWLEEKDLVSAKQ
ncbi:hypothetical protein ACVWXO_002844 [Bradyrhizobium sp. LM2.7]